MVVAPCCVRCVAGGNGVMLALLLLAMLVVSSLTAVIKGSAAKGDSCRSLACARPTKGVEDIFILAYTSMSDPKFEQPKARCGRLVELVAFFSLSVEAENLVVVAELLEAVELEDLVAIF